MANPLNLDEHKMVYDTEDMTASIYRGDGSVQIIKMIVVDEVGGDCMAVCDGYQVFVLEDFIVGIRQQYGRFMTISGDFT